MFSDNYWLYFAASCLLLVAHVIRAARWAQLFPAHDITRRFDLLLGLSLGYAVNAIIPWRLGELVRSWFVAHKESLRFSYVASTVVAERMTDLIVVSFIAAFVLADAQSVAWPLPGLSIILSVALVSFCWLVRQSQKARLIVWSAASVFNDKVRNALVDFVWSTSEIVVGGALLKPRFLFTTLLMWIFYIFSYAIFARASGQALPEMIFAMLGSPLKPAAEQIIVGENSSVFALFAFTGFPVLGVLLYGGLKQLPAFFQVLNARGRYGWYADQSLLKRSRSHFKGEAEYAYFLASLFSGSNTVATSFGLDAIDDGKVHKLFAGGSDAITAMVEVNEQLLIRKFAVGAAGLKLKAQHDWLLNHRSGYFPLVEITQDFQKAQSYHYDMPLVASSNDFYDYIHTNPIADSKRILSEVMERISMFHDQHRGVMADEVLIKKYLIEKAAGNAALIVEFARTFLNDSYTINGDEFDLTQWNCLLDSEWLMSQVSRKSTTVVHGDLTIENIIVAPKNSPGWYIIDPNPDNIFNTSLIDWAKLMQSVHLGYEGLNRNFSCMVANNSIQLPFTKSQAYTELHAQLEATIQRRDGEDCLREIYFHELINYLRLTPYKIRQNRQKGLCFFGCSSILLKRYLERAI